MSNPITRHAGNSVKLSNVAIDSGTASYRNDEDLSYVLETPGRIFNIDASNLSSLITFASGNDVAISGMRNLGEYPQYGTARASYPSQPNLYLMSELNSYTNTYVANGSEYPNHIAINSNINSLFLGHPKKSFTMMWALTVNSDGGLNVDEGDNGPVTYLCFTGDIQIYITCNTNYSQFGDPYIYGPNYLQVTMAIRKQSNGARTIQTYGMTPASFPASFIIAMFYDANSNAVGATAVHIVNKTMTTLANGLISDTDGPWRGTMSQPAGWSTPGTVLNTGGIEVMTPGPIGIKANVGLHEMLIFNHRLADNLIIDWAKYLAQKHNFPPQDKEVFHIQRYW